ncbi:MAG TPA: hypothetical protein PLO53_02400 [Candidatus Hydrogenedentes bacterium]|nr:hypothetical protein [Candidatus Hydrogenedentota bacterium]
MRLLSIPIIMLLTAMVLSWGTARAEENSIAIAAPEQHATADAGRNNPAEEPSDPAGDAARAVVEQYRQTVVTLKIVVSVSFGGDEDENESEANATLISPDGLAVLALSAIDPSALLGSLTDSDPDNTFSLRVVSLRMILPGGEEREAEVVLRDKDLDIVFVRLKEAPASPLPHVDMAQAAESVRILDPYVCIGQEGPIVQRAHTAFIDRIEGRVDRPRMYYLVSRSRTQQVLCSPLFTLGGRLIGFGVTRHVSTDEDDDDLIAVVAPAPQVRELMLQVPPRGETPADSAQP